MSWLSDNWNAGLERARRRREAAGGGWDGGSSDEPREIVELKAQLDHTGEIIADLNAQLATARADNEGSGALGDKLAAAETALAIVGEALIAPNVKKCLVKGFHPDVKRRSEAERAEASATLQKINAAYDAIEQLASDEVTQ